MADEGREGGLGGKSKTFFGFLKRKKKKTENVEKRHRKIKMK